jgi:glucose-1-phosphate thymidylyltransferase
VDLTLGLFPASRPEKMDMVDLDHEGRIRSIQIKPKHTHLHYTWIVAVWTPIFTAFMHDYLKALTNNSKSHETKDTIPGGRELFMSDVILAAMENQISVNSVAFPEGSCLDIGSPEDLMRAVQMAGQGPFGF